MGNNYNKNNPCPICNGKDYCGWVRSRNGILVCCHRIIDLGKEEKVNGFDNHVYYHMYTKNGTGVYEEEEQFLTSRNNFKNGVAVSYKSNDQNSIILYGPRRDPWEKEPEYLDKVYREFLKGMKMDNMP